MEIRSGKVIISEAGGNAGAGSKTCKLALPTAWIRALGITEDNRQVRLCFDGERITVTRKLSMEEFKQRALAKKHLVYAVKFYNAQTLSTLIYADFTAEELQVENYTSERIKTAFGVLETPAWADFLDFLEERCIPRQRAGLRAYLEALGIEEYDPLEIIRRTEGRMAEDEQWIRMEELQ